MRRALSTMLLAACVGAVLACGKYGPPVRAEKSDAPTASEAAQSASEKKGGATQ